MTIAASRCRMMSCNQSSLPIGAHSNKCAPLMRGERQVAENPGFLFPARRDTLVLGLAGGGTTRATSLLGAVRPRPRLCRAHRRLAAALRTEPGEPRTRRG